MGMTQPLLITMQVQSEYEEQQRAHEQVVGQSSNMLVQFNDLQARSVHNRRVLYCRAARNSTIFQVPAVRCSAVLLHTADSVHH